MTMPLSRENLVNWASQSLAFFEIELSRVSSVLLAQAYDSEINCCFDTFDITHSIKILEGSENRDDTAEEKQFKHPPLNGLYKKHFTSPRFLAKNLHNFLQSKPGNSHFKKTWDEAIKMSGSKIIDEAFVNYFAHHITIDPIEIKSDSNKMTGEWIVFHKYNDLNFYLTLAFHGESNEKIYERISFACEFDNLPFRL